MRGAHFFDLLVTLAIGLVLLIAAVDARRTMQSQAGVVGCAQNLQQIAQSLVLYQSTYAGEFPRTRFDPAALPSAYTGADSPDGFAPTGPVPNDVTASIFLLARTMDLSSETFVCPAALSHGLAEEDRFDRTSSKTRSNFRSHLDLNYSVAQMYPDEQSQRAGYALNAILKNRPADFALAADMNPGKAITLATTRPAADATRSANSPNHERDGQNVLFADGSVHYMSDPFVGVNGDNIYGGRPDALQPGNASDSVLVPTWTQGPQVIPGTTTNRRWFLSLTVLMTAALLGGIVWKSRRTNAI